MSWADDHPVLFKHTQIGPYEQLIGISVQDHGNGLPITIGCMEGDPQRSSNHSMTVDNAEIFYERLGKAIKEAKKAKLHKR